MTIEIIFCEAKCVAVSFLNPDSMTDHHFYTEQKEEDSGPYDNNSGIPYDKVVIDFKNRNWRITKYPKDTDALETYKYLPYGRYIVNVIRKDKCTDCQKHEAEKKGAAAAFVVKQS